MTTAAQQESPPLSRRAGAPHYHALRFVVLAATLGGVAYAALYFPYPPGAVPVRVLSWYLRGVARASAAGAWLFDRTAAVNGDVVGGRFSLQIVLDCAALDVHAVYAAAILAFPAPWRRRVCGLVVGTIVLAMVNIGRIVLLYVVGMRWPGVFHVLHEEVLPFCVVLTALSTFVAWLSWNQRTACR